MKTKPSTFLARTACVLLACGGSAAAQHIPDPNDPVILPTDAEVEQFVKNIRESNLRLLARDPDGWDDLDVMIWKSYDKNYKFEPGNKTKDTDGDGMSDYEEMLVNRNPTYKEPIYTKEQLIEQVRQSRRQSIAAQRKGLADLMPRITAGLQRAAQGRPLPARVTEVANREADAVAERERKLDLAEAFMTQHEARRMKAMKGITPEVRKVLNEAGITSVSGVSSGGLELVGPDNATVAASSQTNALWPGGTSTLPDVTGYSAVEARWRRMGIWEAGGGVLATHAAFQFTPPLPAPQVSLSRVVQVDNPVAEGLGIFSDHGTQVAGVMGAGVANLTARGMAYEGRLLAYGSVNDTAEMMAAAATGMTVSNHSYSFRYGWLRSGGVSYWLGRAAAGEDPRFGLYAGQSREIDLVANENENYLSCWSSGNEAGWADAGPVNTTTGQLPTTLSYSRIHDDDGDGIFNIATSQTALHPSDAGAPLPGSVTGTTGSAGTTNWPIGIGLRTLKASATAKNNLVVGNADDLPSGYVNAAGVAISYSSSRGPTDDGRIKPDLVANGTTVTSTAYRLGTAATLANSSFESPFIPTSGGEVTGVTGWTSEPAGSANVKTLYLNKFASNLSQVARINTSGTRIFIDVPAITLTANQQNVLIVSVGNLAAATLAGNQTRISAFVNGFATQLATATVNASTFVIDQTDPSGTIPGTFSDVGLSIAIGATPPTGVVRIVLENAGTGPCFFDNVRWNNVPLNSYTDGVVNTPSAPVSGTSFSTPAVTGALNLLQVLNDTMSGEPLSATTWKTFLTHTADDADRLPAFYANALTAGGAEILYPGPDPYYGNGILNTNRAANHLRAHLASSARRTFIQQHCLHTGCVVDIPFTVVAGTTEAKFSTGWNDPAFQNIPIAAVDQGLPAVGPTDPPNPTASMLMNDVDMRVLRVDALGNVLQTYSPYRLDAANPRNPATMGDNSADNSEQIVITNPPAGTYIARLSHKTVGAAYVVNSSSGTLRRLAKLVPGHPQYSPTIPRFEVIFGGSQKFSLIASGVVERPSDAFKATNISRATTPTQSFTVIDWQSIRGIRYEAERSTDLAVWTKLTNAEVGIATNPSQTWLSAAADDGSETVTVVQPVSSTRYFFRIREAGL